MATRRKEACPNNSEYVMVLCLGDIHRGIGTVRGWFNILVNLCWIRCILKVDGRGLAATCSLIRVPFWRLVRVDGRTATGCL
jgi:hypothetical protein